MTTRATRRRPIRRAVSVAWLAILGTGCFFVIASYSTPFRYYIAPGNAYGLRLDHGVLELFRGQHFGGLDPSVAGQWMRWDALDATDTAPGFVQTDALQGTWRAHPWPPFWYSQSAGYTWSRVDLNGVKTFDGWRREITSRAGSAWIVLLVATAPMVLVLINAYRRNPAAGACACKSCGYDLRATPERCPECGRETRDAHIAGAT